jgi:hypothetical protein
MSYKGGIFEAIKSLQPYAEFGLRDNDYDTLEWYDDPTVVPIPTKEEVETELARLISEYNNNEYQRKRAEEYPAIADQLDYIYHNGIDAWKEDMIEPIKTKYPKGVA